MRTSTKKPMADFLKERRLQWDLFVSQKQTGWCLVGVRTSANQGLFVCSLILNSSYLFQLRQSLDGLLNQLKNFPARLRQYASYEYVQRLLKGYMKVIVAFENLLGYNSILIMEKPSLWSFLFLSQINMLVIELKSEALKDRHWKQLMKRLHVNWVVSELTLGQIWDVDLQKNELIVKDVLLVAQGEMALEEFLKQVTVGLLMLLILFIP